MDGGTHVATQFLTEKKSKKGKVENREGGRKFSIWTSLTSPQPASIRLHLSRIKKNKKFPPKLCGVMLQLAFASWLFAEGEKAE